MEYLFNNLAAFQRGNELKVSKVPSSSHPLMFEIKEKSQNKDCRYQLSLSEIRELRDLLDSLIAV